MNIFWLASDGDKATLRDAVEDKHRISFYSDKTQAPKSNCDLILINCHAECLGGERLAPLKWLQRQRLLGITVPAVIYSALSESTILSQSSVVKSPGVWFLRRPARGAELVSFLESNDFSALNETELAEVLRWHAGLQDQWRDSGHAIANLTRATRFDRKKALTILEDWAESIDRYAADQSSNLAALRNELGKTGKAFDLGKVETCLQNLNRGLQVRGASGVISQPADRSKTPHKALRYPPEGYSKVLIADDHSQDFVAKQLSQSYHYEVYSAHNAQEALRVLQEKGCTVVLADYYFKANRNSQPESEVGRRFINNVVSLNPRPIVLVTSKAALNPETDFSRKAVNCTGSAASDPETINSLIWIEARKRGVAKPADFNGTTWSPLNEVRETLLSVAEELEKISRQWERFPQLASETGLLASKIVGRHKNTDEGASLASALVDLLEATELDGNTTLAELKQLFSGTSQIHRLARAGEESESKRLLRNILHGKIEQFASVFANLQVIQRLVGEEAARLIGEQLDSATRSALAGLDAFPRMTDGSCVKSLLEESRRKIDESLEALPTYSFINSRISPSQVMASNPKKLRVLIAEDDEFWAEEANGAVKQLARVYGSSLEVKCERYSEAAGLLKSIPKRKSTHIIAQDAEKELIVALVDLCLPKDEAQAQAVLNAARSKRAKIATPDSSNGIRLIEELVAYERNIATIVFSTIDSANDRMTVCNLGIPDNNFISKGPNASKNLAMAMARIVDKSQRFSLRQTLKASDGPDTYEYRLNGVPLNLSETLSITLSAIFEHCFEEGPIFNADDISSRLESNNFSLKQFGDHINRLRETIWQRFKENRRYIDIYDFLSTFRSQESGFCYALNADLVLPDADEDGESFSDGYLEELREMDKQTKEVLVLSPSDAFNRTLNFLGDAGVAISTAVDLDKAETFFKNRIKNSQTLPKVVIIDTTAISVIDAVVDGIKGVTENMVVGFIFLFDQPLEKEVLDRLIQRGSIIDNFVSMVESNWQGRLCRAINVEVLRLELGESAMETLRGPIPMIRTLPGTSVGDGLVEIEINGRPFAMRPSRKASQLSRILAALVSSEAFAVSWESLEAVLNVKSISENDKKNWTRRLRGHIAKRWLNPELTAAGRRFEAMKILESSDKGLRLNAQRG